MISHGEKTVNDVDMEVAIRNKNADSQSSSKSVHNAADKEGRGSLVVSSIN